ncbi:MAG: hypothetical protein BGP04_19155 [Rhizobiales bacterium 62-17]|nr:hypothetical protein [Hyphomicrobiales bacterium]OJX99790.1 MAG: hypothetical protein BGP04_19155 [Rhizobiales bacterium 62-17]
MGADNKPSRLVASLAISDNPRTWPVIDGRVTIDGVDVRTTVLHPSEMFWRQLKYAEFDISEMSISSLMIAASKGDRTWVAIPVFTMRSFFQTWGFKRLDRGIVTPVDLVGKRVGVPEYQQTSAIWSRGIFKDRYGLDQRDVEWFMERVPGKSHGGSTGFQPPQGVRIQQIPSTTNIGEMLVKGELDATLLYLTDKNLVDRSRIDITQDAHIGPMFADNLREGQDYLKDTGIFPVNHTLVVRRSLLEQNPWLGLNILKAFESAKALTQSRMIEMAEPWQTSSLDASAGPLLQSDPMPYGIKRNRTVLETLARYLAEQGLTPAPCALEDIFLKQALDL